MTHFPCVQKIRHIPNEMLGLQRVPSRRCRGDNEQLQTWTLANMISVLQLGSQQGNNNVTIQSTQIRNEIPNSASCLNRDFALAGGFRAQGQWGGFFRGGR